MRKNKTQRYRMTKCKDKRSIVRALNTFSQQYKFIYCGQKEIHLEFESMELNYGNKESEFSFGLGYEETNKITGVKKTIESYEEKNIIYAKSEAIIDLYNKEYIFDAIDNLISINRQRYLKQALKEVVQQSDNDGKNKFFSNEITALNDINLAINNDGKKEYSDQFIIKLLSQIKNRVIFRRSGIYTNNDKPTKVIAKKTIKPIPTSVFEILQKQLEFLLENLSMLLVETRDKVMQARMVSERDHTNRDFDIEYTDFEKNSSFFHPIDEDEYNDPEAKESTKENNMPLPMLHRKLYGLYHEEDWNAYYQYEDYETIVDELIEIMNELIAYINDKEKLHSTIQATLNTQENEEFEYYKEEKLELMSLKELKDYRIKFIYMLDHDNKKKTLHNKVSLLQQYFLYEDIVELLYLHKNDLWMYGFVFNEKEFLKACEIQKQIFGWYKCKSFKEYKDKFEKEGIDSLLLKWFGESDMIVSYWFDASNYPCYAHLLPESENICDITNEDNEKYIDEEELMRNMGYTFSQSAYQPLIPFGDDESKDDKDKSKQQPPIPF